MLFNVYYFDLCRRFVYLVYDFDNNRPNAQQTVFLGPTWNFGGSFHYPSFFGRSVADGMLLAFSGATQWRLAASLANRQLRTPV